MLLIYTSDLHGEIQLYQELLQLVRSTPAEVVALGGDLLPSFAPTKRYEDMIPHQKIFIDQFLIPFFRTMTETTTVDEVFLIPGNWDLGYPVLFLDPVEKVVDLGQRAYRLRNGYELIGYPYVPPTPFRPKDYEKMDDLASPWPPQKNPSYVRSTDPPDQVTPVDPDFYLRHRGSIQDDLEQLPAPLDFRKTIYIMHSPPYKTRLDRILGGGEAGSRSIRAFIEKHQPLMTLHGHIHESPELSGAYFDPVGNTLSINPGQSLSKEASSRLHAVTFEIENPRETLRHTCFR